MSRRFGWACVAGSVLFLGLVFALLLYADRQDEECRERHGTVTVEMQTKGGTRHVEVCAKGAR